MSFHEVLPANTLLFSCLTFAVRPLLAQVIKHFGSSNQIEHQIVIVVNFGGTTFSFLATHKGLAQRVNVGMPSRLGNACQGVHFPLKGGIFGALLGNLLNGNMLASGAVHTFKDAAKGSHTQRLLPINLVLAVNGQELFGGRRRLASDRAAAAVIIWCIQSESLRF